MNWYVAALRKYVDFSGRARRKEYWFFVLFNIIALILLVIIDSVIGTYNAEAGVGVLSSIYSLGVLLPSIAVAVRRLHDTNRSGWWLLIAFVPVIGAIVLIVFYVLDGTPGGNRFGPDPKQEPAPA